MRELANALPVKTRTYPVAKTIWRALARVTVAVLLMIGFVIGMELLRFVALLRRLHPMLAYGMVGLLCLALIILVIRAIFWRAARQTLFAPRLPPPDKATFKDLKHFVQHVVKRLKRMSNHQSLSTEQARNIRQQTYDIESMLNAHPLLDDLRRAIGKTESNVWFPMIEQLDQDAIEFAHYKMQAVVRDTVEPPFPIIQPLMVFYHQLTMTCCIADCYLPNASLTEYATVIRDTWRVMSRGEYFRVGQRLFDGIYRNSPPAGAAADDLGQALSVIWLTWTTAQIAMHRCRTYRKWTVEQAIAYLDHLTIDSLLVTRDTLIRDVLPMIRLRLRHSVGPAVADAAGFSEQVMEGITKAVDGVIQGLRAQGPEEVAEQSRRTQHGLYQNPGDRSHGHEKRKQL